VPEVLFQHQREGKPFSDERVEVVDCDWDVIPGEGFMNSGPANTFSLKQYKNMELPITL